MSFLLFCVKMKKYIGNMVSKFVSGVVLIFILMGFGLPGAIEKRVDKEIKSTFSIENYTLSEIIIDADLAKTLPSKFNHNNLFKIEENNSLLGYAYVSQAPSKTAQYDYLVLLDTNLIVIKSKVLIYREEYGGEIGSKRWLRQFEGKTQNDVLNYPNDIVAISGATISARSMTNAMNDFLKSLNILNAKNVL